MKRESVAESATRSVCSAYLVEVADLERHEVKIPVEGVWTRPWRWRGCAWRRVSPIRRVQRVSTMLMKSTAVVWGKVVEGC